VHQLMCRDACFHINPCQAKSETLVDRFAFQALDKSCRWSVTFFQVLESDRLVATFRPADVLVGGRGDARPFRPPQRKRRVWDQAVARLGALQDDEGDPGPGAPSSEGSDTSSESFDESECSDESDEPSPDEQASSGDEAFHATQEDADRPTRCVCDSLAGFPLYRSLPLSFFLPPSSLFSSPRSFISPWRLLFVIIFVCTFRLGCLS
jgi:hypothetical protein